MLNKVTLIGYTGKAVEQKYTPGGTAVARVSVATSKRVKKNDEWQSVTQWHECVLFGKPAESEYIITIARALRCLSKANCSTGSFRKRSATRMWSGR
jgi:hypothetical protein